ncbi:MAG: LptF/LptG family permease [Aphanocapsa sp. GSE-SYN-MK-11-07L]|nr:LptF/LptG family permease [Aphanocapsa sp. GSE-SYN-MK-11-07L]
MSALVLFPKSDRSKTSIHFCRFQMIERYIVAEMAAPFLFGVVAFTAVASAIGIIFDLVRLVSDGKMSLAAAFTVFGLALPTYLVLAFPMSMLLSTLLTYSSLSKSSEITALKSFGVSAYRMAVPAILASLVMTGITFVFNEAIVPATSYQAELTRAQALDRVQSPYRDKNIFYREFVGDALARIFYARRFDGKKMQQISILNFSEGKLKEILVAKTATWNPAAEAWDFSDGTLYRLTADQSYREIDAFSRKQLAVPRTPLDLAMETRPPTQMNVAEATRFLSLVEQTGDERWIRKLKVQIQEKFALPFVCVAFAVVGTALGIRSRQATNSKGFGLSVMIIFGFYLVSFICLSLGEGGLLSPLMAAWLPKLGCFGIGLFLLSRAAR